jgi:hypothetical protein
LRIGVLVVRVLAVPILLMGALVWLLALVVVSPFYASRCLYRRFFNPPKAMTEIAPDVVSLSDRVIPPSPEHAKAARS